LGYHYSGLAFDTALDVGTLLALYIFFAKDFIQLGRDFVFGGPQRKLAGYILAATVPGVIGGVLVQHAAETVFRSSQLVAINLIWVGIVMWLVDRLARRSCDIANVKLPE